MARRKSVRRRRTFFGRKRARRSGAITMRDLAIGGGLMSVGEPFLERFAAPIVGATGLGSIAMDGAKVIGGWFLAKKTRGIAKGAGIALMLFGIRNIVGQTIVPAVSGLAGGAANGGGFQQTVF